MSPICPSLELSTFCPLESRLIVLQEMLAEVGDTGLSVLGLRRQFEDRLLILATC